MSHGHERADERNLALHRLALEKLRLEPVDGRRRARELLDRWSAMPHLSRQLPFLLEWRRLLELSPEELESTILSESGQQLRQCSPLGVLISPRERFELYEKLSRR
jgi:hypothetical protein